jgi:hypothetical protein
MFDRLDSDGPPMRREEAGSASVATMMSAAISGEMRSSLWVELYTLMAFVYIHTRRCERLVMGPEERIEATEYVIRLQALAVGAFREAPVASQLRSMLSCRRTGPCLVDTG